MQYVCVLEHIQCDHVLPNIAWTITQHCDLIWIGPTKRRLCESSRFNCDEIVLRRESNWVSSAILPKDVLNYVLLIRQGLNFHRTRTNYCCHILWLNWKRTSCEIARERAIAFVINYSDLKHSCLRSNIDWILPVSKHYRKADYSSA